MKKLIGLALSLSLNACAGTVKVGDVVMLTPSNDLMPTGVVVSVTQLATVAAQSAANAQSAALLQAALAETTAKGDAYEAMYQAREGTIWIESFNVWRIGEKASVNTNITAEIIKADFKYKTVGTNNFHRLYTFFSEDPGYDPFVRVGRALGSTNGWDSANVTSNYLANVTVGATTYQDCSVTEFTTPTVWSNAFMRVGSEVRGASTNAVNFPVNNGIKVGTENPLTLIATYGTNKVRIVGGVACVPK